MVTPVNVSAIWFGEKERTTSTAVATIANNLGQGLAFVFTPYLVKNFGIQYFLTVEAVFSFVLMCLFFMYFPASPKSPPSNTTPVFSKKKSFMKDLILCLKKSLLCNTYIIWRNTTRVDGSMDRPI